MRRTNYDKCPSTSTEGRIWKGWDDILKQIKSNIKYDNRHILVVECYQGVNHEELLEAFSKLGASVLINTQDAFKEEKKIRQFTHSLLTNDRLFGYRNTSISFNDFLDERKVLCMQQTIQCHNGLVIVYGHGASEIYKSADTLVYADMPRWEIQLRSRRHEINGLGVENKEEAPSLHYKRGYFLDWNICDNLKKRIFKSVDYWIDSTIMGSPKMIDASTMDKGLRKTAHKPFRVVPFFDPAPWGGQWMKEVCGLDKSKENFGWCFDCVPEENSLYMKVNGELFEMPSNNLVFYQTRPLLGAPVEARFGQDFPIRFDFLDTMGGGNLSLQVHPTTQYIRDIFGMVYTQDESYYILDAEEDATVYLGLKNGVDPDKMINALNESQENGKSFDVERYVNKWPAAAHDHYLIPAGTIHCSGSGVMVLEISATPSIFTFKLWDWGRLGLDGLPRPINITHGSHVIQWERQTDYVKSNLVNHFQKITEGIGWNEERTGLHENEFIETRRHWFTDIVPHDTNGGVNVLNVIKGDELIVESPTGDFEPFIVHYAETFIVPASVGKYTIRPYGRSKGQYCGTIKAYVRFKD